MLERQNQVPAGAVIQHGAPGAGEHRRLADARTANLIRVCRLTGPGKFERQPAPGAQGIANKANCRPAINAQAADHINQHPAPQTLRGQQYVQRHPTQMVKFCRRFCVCHNITMTESMTIFNRHTVRRHRERAAAKFGDYNFLVRDVGERLIDRLGVVRRDFPVALDLGCHDGTLGHLLDDHGGIRSLFQCDLSEQMTARAGPLAVVADEEFLPFAPASFDLVLSNLSLHWVNDLPGALAQLRRTIKPGGLILAAMLGGDTLKELRHALASAEIALENGLSPRVSPFADVRDVGNLLSRAGFTGAVADGETLTVSYGNPLTLLKDLRGMGETNAVIENRKGFTARSTLMQAMTTYQETFADEDGRFPATFQVIYLTAWVPEA